MYHMDMKSSFLSEELEEEVYIEQPEGFQLLENADYVCKLKKSVYGLKEGPIQSNGFHGFDESKDGHRKEKK
jgi:hypothetical protein